MPMRFLLVFIGKKAACTGLKVCRLLSVIGAGKTISRVLSSDSHSSRPCVAARFEQPTRTLGEQRHRVLFGLAPNGV